MRYRPYRGLIASAVPAVRCSLAHAVKAAFVLPMIVAAPDDETRFGPNDLRYRHEIRRLQGLEDDVAVQRGVPDVGDVALIEFPRLGPIGGLVVGDAPDGAATDDVLPQRLVSPIGIVIHAVGRISHHQP